ncbi:C4-dicarboxylic acid transporter DauA [Ectothiorhodospiraceae bacterium WFHF3C12]|nr:C4-dicarboxylic acid transporter DauA [Ectothiorhodospiraceae bacterium WFHF3C12]
MPHRAHLTSLGLASAFRQACITERYDSRRFRGDLFAGLTVGLIALPLSMALAIASGVPPQHGLYTAIIAGALIALTGGSRFSVSGPTAAFVVILHPVSAQFGLGGLLVATLIAGGLLMLMAVARLGRLIEYIPPPVTLGFTAGIAVVIATLQLPDLLGLTPQGTAESYLGKVAAIWHALPAVDGGSVLVGGITLAVIVLWPRLRTPLPGHLPAVLAGVAASLVLAAWGMDVATIGSSFSYTLADGTTGQGIPPVLPELRWPWDQPGPDGAAIEWSMDTVRSLLPAAFSIAALGAIESLLCAVVLDGMSGRRHSANGELLGQGIGNLVVPLFGGIPATAAIARSSANYSAGAQSPVSSVVHAGVVGLALVALAPWLSYLPMASMAALLLMVAWKMSEAHKVRSLLRKAPAGDVAVLLTCFSLTVLFDMVIAIAVGVVLASVLFMRDVAAMTRASDITDSPRLKDSSLPPGWSVYKISGPLFFAAADRVFAELALKTAGRQGVVLYMDGVPILDAGGLSALEGFLQAMERQGTRVVIADLQFQPLKTLARARLRPVPGQLQFTATLEEGLRASAQSLPSRGAAALNVVS